MPVTFLSTETRRQALAALNDAARVVFPGLLASVETLAEAASWSGRIRLNFDDLPGEVLDYLAELRAANLSSLYSENPEDKERWLLSRALGKYIQNQNEHSSRFRAPLNAFLWPVLEKNCLNIKVENLRLIWDQMLDSRVQAKLIADTILNLAKEFSLSIGSTNSRSVELAELFIFRNVWYWPQPLSPSLAFAVTEAMGLFQETHALPEKEILSWALRLGRIKLAEKVLPSSTSGNHSNDDLKDRIERFCSLSTKTEGLVCLLGAHLDEYINNLEEFETRYYGQTGGIPELEALQLIASQSKEAPASQFNQELGVGSLAALRGLAEQYLQYHESIFHAMPNFISALFYLSREDYQTDRVKRVVEQAERWLCYWFLNCHRYGKQQPSFNSDSFAELKLRLSIVRAWHETNSPVDLLAKARQFMGNASYRDWADLNSEIPSRGVAEYLLPCWLLEIRALRLHGRGSPEWIEANALTEDRLTQFLNPSRISELWSREPGFLLFVLESARQVAVACTQPEQASRVSSALMNIARELHVRLEMIDCPRTRRILFGFLHPILTAIAGWRTRTYSDPAEGLCLFQMARSKWITDQLSLGNRTLMLQSSDDEPTGELKDRFFNEIAEAGVRPSGAYWNVPSDTLLADLQQANPDLSRIIVSNWLKPEMLKSIPSDAAALTFESDQDPADPPLFRLSRTLEPWSSPAAGNDSDLWIFLVTKNGVNSALAQGACSDIFAETRTLKSLFAQGLLPQCQPAYSWSRLEIERYTRQLDRLAQLLIRPMAELITSSSIKQLLIVPSGDLHEIPWSALPVSSPHSSCLIDLTAIGVLPSLGLAFWQTQRIPRVAIDIRNSEILLQAAPNPPSGLLIEDVALQELRKLAPHVSEDGNATPSQAIAALQTRDFVAFLCHGRLEPGLFLELSPSGERGRLTAQLLESMPAIESDCTVLLGACWSGLNAQYAAEGVEGLASLLLLKGVKSVFAGNGSIPLPVKLIVNLTSAIFESAQDKEPEQGMAQLLRKVQLRLRKKDSNQESRLVHPWNWSSIAFHGVPWH